MIQPLGGRQDLPSASEKSLSRARRADECIVKGCSCTYVFPVMFGGGLSAAVRLCPFHSKHFWDKPMPPHPDEPCGCLACGHAHHSGRCATMVSHNSTKYEDAVQCDCTGGDHDATRG